MTELVNDIPRTDDAASGPFDLMDPTQLAAALHLIAGAVYTSRLPLPAGMTFRDHEVVVHVLDDDAEQVAAWATAFNLSTPALGDTVIAESWRKLSASGPWMQVWCAVHGTPSTEGGQS